jgi:hypothetical protein
MASRRDIQELKKQAECQGWVVEPTRKGHYKWISPSGNFFFSASTPSDHRAMNNIKRDLRVNGFIIIERRKGRK